MLALLIGGSAAELRLLLALSASTLRRWHTLLFGIVNLFIGTILRILTLPLTLLTFGLFLIIVNALLLEITDALSSHLTIDDFFWTAILAAIILSLATMLLDWAVRSVLAPAAAT